MFPYPSGDLHMGHAEIFSIHDALVRQRRMLGERVLNPIGWDAFGLPAENAARKRGIDPRTWTYANIEEQAASIARLGYSFDWSTRLNTCDPTYYRWTQWVFVQLMKAGLADRREGLVNWCPGCETVLANEQVIDGRCERSDDLVIRRPLVQWYLRISEYAQQLLDDLAGLDWPDRVKNIQRNWIGRSEGAILRFRGGRDRRAGGGLHHPARHAVRRHLRRVRSRAPAGAGAHGRRSGLRGLPRRCDHALGDRAAVHLRGPARQARPATATSTWSTPSTASRCPPSPPTTC